MQTRLHLSLQIVERDATFRCISLYIFIHAPPKQSPTLLFCGQEVFSAQAQHFLKPQTLLSRGYGDSAPVLKIDKVGDSTVGGEAIDRMFAPPFFDVAPINEMRFDTV